MGQFKTLFNDFLKNNGIWIALGVFVLIVIVVLIFILVPKFKKKKVDKGEIKNLWLNSLGGEENIISIEQKGSRLIASLKDYNLIDKEQLKTLGATNFILSSSKITIVLNDKDNNVGEIINKN